MVVAATEISMSFNVDLSSNISSKKKETIADLHLCMWRNTRKWKMGLGGPWEDAEAGN